MKHKFGKNLVFIPSLHPNYFGGLPGYFLSYRELRKVDATKTQTPMNLIVIGPRRTAKTIKKA
jgi:hypothetical protein